MASAPSKTVVVLGASYGGARAAQVIAAGLPEGWRLVLIDRNSHLNHVYILPRLAVLPGHEHKAFIPYENIFNLGPSTNRCTFIQATILALTPHSITLSRAVPELGVGGDGVLAFDYAVYALGSRLPEPLDLWDTSNSSSACTSNLDANAINGKPAILHAPYGGTKLEGIAWLKRKQRVVEEAASVLVVGGGALGIQFASDIAAVHPTKRVTLLHSRARLLPRFDGGGEEGGEEILQALHALNVHVVLGERVDLASLSSLAPSSSDAEARADDTTTAGQRTVRTVRTTTGREIGADLVLLCTGQTPNTALLRALDPRIVDPASGLARVGRGMQLAFGKGDASPSASSPSSAPSPTSPSHSLVGELDKQAADADPAANDDEEEPVVAGETHEAASVDDDEETPYPHIFAIGDAADAFGALPAGHNAWAQGEVAGRNVLRLISRYGGNGIAGEGCEGKKRDEGLELETYTPGPPAIKVSLGLHKTIYQVNGTVGVTVGKEREDLNAAAMWGVFGCPIRAGEEDGEEMFR
ncbi:hypothetical protein B0H13DRAFT_1727879 [Mycena leptocephala]|nr:hypothetical protein B0H13DRAFT_1727879 [Mycena leptocephala]